MLQINSAHRQGRGWFNIPGPPPTGGDFELFRPHFDLPRDRSGTPLQFDPTTGLINNHVVDITLPWTLGSPPGTVRNVNDTASFNSALAAAVYGDEIVVAAGTVILGPIVLPSKIGFNPNDPTKRIIIRTSNVNNLPVLSDTGMHVSPSNAADLFTIKVVNAGSSDPPIRPDASASGYRFIGARFWDDKSIDIYANLRIGFEDSLVRFACNGVTDATKSSFLSIDRCWVDGNNRSSDNISVGTRGGVESSADDCFIHQCYISNIFDKDRADSHAVATSDGVNRIRITRNFLEACSENIIFGGAGSKLSQANPMDIEIRGNYLFKKPEWEKTPANIAAGTARNEDKNHLEVKKGIRVLFEGNWCVNKFDAAQEQAVILQSNSQDNLEPAALGQDITVRFNRFDNIYAFCNIGSRNGTNSTTPGNRFEIVHNVVTSISQKIGDSNQYIFQYDAQCPNIIFRYNTACQPHSILQMHGSPIPAGTTNYGLIYENNISYLATTYGINGDGGFPNELALNHFLLDPTNWAVRCNKIVTPTNNPLSTLLKDAQHNNEEVFDKAAFGFTNAAANDFSLSNSSPYKNESTDGIDPGVHWPLLLTLLSGVSP